MRRFIENIFRLTLAVIIGLALVSSLPTTAQAGDNPVDLELGGEGATSWSISNIKPGDNGTKTVTLHNAGYNNGFVTIWISDTLSSEGINPESETGDTTEPGELIDYLVLNLSCNGLSTNLSLPTTIDNFPQSASDPNYIKVSPLNAGDTLNLDWNWELPSQTGNDVQGDSLSFTINYLLEEFPTASPPPGGGGGGGGGGYSIYRSLWVDVLGETTELTIRTDGTFYKSYVVADTNGNLILEIDRGTTLTCGGNQLPERLEVTLAKASLPVADGMATVSPVYDFTAYTHSIVWHQVKFDPPIKLTLNYHPEALPENAWSVFIARYDDEQGFTRLEPPAGSVAEVGKAKAEVNHLTSFVVMAKLVPPPPPAPANFEVSNLTINPSPAQPDQPIAISLTVTNSGGTTGSYALQLRIDGIVRTLKEITLAPQSSRTISFEVSNLAAGEHQIEVAGLTSQFSVLSPPSSPAKPPTPAKPTMPAGPTINWTLLGLIIATVVVIGSLVLSSVKPEVILATARKLHLW